jgi:hypothetical protein
MHVQKRPLADAGEQPRSKRQRVSTGEERPSWLSSLVFGLIKPSRPGEPPAATAHAASSRPDADASTRPATPTPHQRPALAARAESFAFRKINERSPVKHGIFGLNRRDARQRQEQQKHRYLLQQEREWRERVASGQYNGSLPTYLGFKQYKEQISTLQALDGNVSPVIMPEKSKSNATVQQELRRQRKAEDRERIQRNASYSLNTPLPSPSKLGMDKLSLKSRDLDRRIDRKAIPARRFRKKLEAEMDDYVTKAFKQTGVFSTMPGAEVAQKDITKLQPDVWLNDEVINFYMIMLNARSKAHQEALQNPAPGGKKKRLAKGDEPLDVHCFTSFFYTKLCASTGYAGVRRWTKKVDVFAKDAILLPINLGNSHWVSACINIRKKRFEYYDSLGSWNENAIRVRCASSHPCAMLTDLRRDSDRGCTKSTRTRRRRRST